MVDGVVVPKCSRSGLGNIGVHVRVLDLAKILVTYMRFNTVLDDHLKMENCTQ